MESKKLPRGIRNNNPFNIRHGNNWKGERKVQTDRSFEEFDNMVMGIRAGMVLMKNYIEGRTQDHRRYNTLATLIGRWAPPSENATWNYIDFVSNEAQISPFSVIRFDDRDSIIRIAKAMTFLECGVRIPDEDFEGAYNLINPPVV